jgi:hypothetical protein
MDGSSLPEGKIWANFRPKTAISLHRCAMIEEAFFDQISDFAKFIALSRDQVITNPIRQLYAQ